MTLFYCNYKDFNKYKLTVLLLRNHLKTSVTGIFI